MVPVDITNAVVATVAQGLPGLAGSVGVYSIILQHWFLRFGVVSLGLRQIFGEF